MKKLIVILLLMVGNFGMANDTTIYLEKEYEEIIVANNNDSTTYVKESHSVGSHNYVKKAMNLMLITTMGGLVILMICGLIFGAVNMYKLARDS